MGVHSFLAFLYVWKFSFKKCWKDSLTREKGLFIKIVHRHKIFKLLILPFFTKAPLNNVGAFIYLYLFLLSHLPFSLWQPRGTHILVLGKGMFHSYTFKT